MIKVTYKLPYGTEKEYATIEKTEGNRPFSVYKGSPFYNSFRELTEALEFASKDLNTALARGFIDSYKFERK